MKMKFFFDQIGDKEKTIINDALSDFIFGCDIDAEVVESDYFIKLVKLLRPTYTPPTSEEMFSIFSQKNGEETSGSKYKIEN